MTQPGNRILWFQYSFPCCIFVCLTVFLGYYSLTVKIWKEIPRIHGFRPLWPQTSLIEVSLRSSSVRLCYSVLLSQFRTVITQIEAAGQKTYHVSNLLVNVRLVKKIYWLILWIVTIKISCKTYTWFESNASARGEYRALWRVWFRCFPSLYPWS